MIESDENLPRGWTIVSVARVGGVRLGRQRSPDKHTGRFATKYIRAANIAPDGLEISDLLEMDFTPSERKVFSLRVGDIVLTEASGSAAQVGRAALWRGEVPGCCYQNTVIRFRPHAAVPEYALVVFRHFAAAGVFARTARGVGIQHLGASRFAELPFPLPPFLEQQRIAAEADRRRTKLRDAQASLNSALRHIGEQNREILAAAAYGELIESEVVNDGNWSLDDAPLVPDAPPNVEQPSLFEVAGGLTSEIVEALRRRELPLGWTWIRMGDAGELKLGRQRSPKHQRGNNPTPYLRVANVQEDAIDFEDLTMMDFTPQEQEDYRVTRGDILLSVGQSPELVGRPALVREDVPLICFQNHLARLRPKPFIDSEYALIVLRHYLHTGVFRSVAKWSTNLATLSLSRLAALPFPLPPLSIQRRIVAAARQRLDASRVQEHAIRLTGFQRWKPSCSLRQLPVR